MAIPADTVWEIQSTGSDSNGGGWSNANKGATGTDMSQGAPTTFTSNLSAVGTATLTGVGFTNTLLGNVINIVGQGLYCIIGFTSSVAVTVDRNLGTFSTTTGVVGGPLATPGKMGSAMTAGNIAYIKAATYSITSATANVASGCVTIPAQTASANVGKLIGYSSSRGDLGRPTLQASGISTFSILTVGTGNSVENLIIDGASLVSSRGIVASNGRAFNCKVVNCSNFGIFNGDALYCEVTGCTGANNAGIQAVNTFRCVSHDNTSSCNGFQPSGGGSVCVDCIAYGNNIGFTDNSNFVRWINCTSYANASHGFNLSTGTGNAGSNLYNCLSYGNTGDDLHSNTNVQHYAYNVFVGKAVVGSVTVIGSVTLTADPFTNASGHDFSLNTTAGGGAAVRAAGLPGPFPGISTTGYLDGGAVQHQDPVSGGSMVMARVLTGM